jgi:hypothetical protein
VRSTPRIAAILPAAAISYAIDPTEQPMLGADGAEQQGRQQISTVKVTTLATCRNDTYLFPARAMSPVLDNGNDLRVQTAKAAATNATGPEHVYLHFNEWSRAQKH